MRLTRAVPAQCNCSAGGLAAGLASWQQLELESMGGM